MKGGRGRGKGRLGSTSPSSVYAGHHRFGSLSGYICYAQCFKTSLSFPSRLAICISSTPYSHACHVVYIPVAQRCCTGSWLKLPRTSLSTLSPETTFSRSLCRCVNRASFPLYMILMQVFFALCSRYIRGHNWNMVLYPRESSLFIFYASPVRLLWPVTSETVIMRCVFIFPCPPLLLGLWYLPLRVRSPAYIL